MLLALLPALAAVFLLPVGYLVWVFVMARPPSVPPGTTVTEFSPPEEIGPAEAAFLLDGKVSPRAFAAMIVDLELRGHVAIDEAGGVLMGLRKTGTPDSTLSSLEKMLLRVLFSDSSSVGPADASARVRKDAVLLKAGLVGVLRDKGAIAARSESLVIIFVSSLAAAAVVFLTLIPAIGGFGAFVALVVQVFLAQLAYIAATLRPRLTDRGIRLYRQLQGFKTYLKTAETDRIRWEETERRTRHRSLPYAIVFGITLTWATRLQSLTNAFLKTGP
jgi:hypothetical protein